MIGPFPYYAGINYLDILSYRSGSAAARETCTRGTGKPQDEERAACIGTTGKSSLPSPLPVGVHRAHTRRILSCVHFSSSRVSVPVSLRPSVRLSRAATRRLHASLSAVPASTSQRLLLVRLAKRYRSVRDRRRQDRGARDVERGLAVDVPT